MSKNLSRCSGIPPSTQAALRCAGYETINDLASASAETLSKELGIAIADAQNLIHATQTPKTVPMTQSAASLAKVNVFACKWPPVNKVLGGGLPRSHILEISGPPGSFKESLACDFARTFVEVNEEVVFVGDYPSTSCVSPITERRVCMEDMQNMTSPHAISRLLESTASAKTLVYYRRVHALPDLFIFLHNLNSEVRQKVDARVFPSPEWPDAGVNSDWACGIEFPPICFSVSPRFVTIKKERHLREYSADSFGNMCDQEPNTLDQVIITSQMATKILHSDGSPATFDSGSKAVMVPQLGTCIPPVNAVD
ncbi:hypothetical protein V8B97DRAFT_2009691 [Scleroderma yunnanense]